MPSKEDLLEIAKKIDRVKTDHSQIVNAEGDLKKHLDGAIQVVKKRYEELTEGKELPKGDV